MKKLIHAIKLETHQSVAQAVLTVKTISTAMLVIQTSSDMFSKITMVKEQYVLKNAQQEHQTARIQMTVLTVLSATANNVRTMVNAQAVNQAMPFKRMELVLTNVQRLSGLTQI